MNIPMEKLAFIIIKAREYDEEVLPEGLESGSNPADDGGVSILESTRDNPTDDELKAALEGLNVDELAEVLALTWMGRGDFEKSQWPEAFKMAQSNLNERTVDYLMQTPLLGDLMEEGLAQLGRSVTDYYKGHL